MKAKVRLVEALGSELMVHFELDDAKRVNSGDPDAPEELLGEGVANAVARFSPRVTGAASTRTSRSAWRARTSTSSTPRRHQAIWS